MDLVDYATTHLRKKKQLTRIKKTCTMCFQKVPEPHVMWGMEGKYTCPVCLKEFNYNKVAGSLTCGHFTCKIAL